MVRMKGAMLALVWVFLPASEVFSETRIESVRVASADVVRVKPCEPVFVLLDVVTDVPLDKDGVGEVLGGLAENVLVNDKRHGCEYDSGPVNPVAVFAVDEEWVEKVGVGDGPLRVVMMMYLNLVERDYVFATPGEYRVVLRDNASVDVIVEEGSEEEKELVRVMRTKGLEYGLFVVRQRDPKAGGMIALFEELLARYSGTAYGEQLSVCYGLSALPAMSSAAYGEAPFIPAAHARERVAFARKYFGPYCRGAIASPYQSAAAYELAKELLNQLRYEGQPLSEVAAGTKREAISLLRKVRDSPYSLQHRVDAARILRELGVEVSGGADARPLVREERP